MVKEPDKTKKGHVPCPPITIKSRCKVVVSRMDQKFKNEDPCVSLQHKLLSPELAVEAGIGALLAAALGAAFGAGAAASKSIE